MTPAKPSDALSASHTICNRASLHGQSRLVSECTGAEALLDPGGPRTILGWKHDVLSEAVVPSSRTCFGPRGVCFLPNGSLWVADSGHHRVLGWLDTPSIDNSPSDIVLGQPDFKCEGRNARGKPDLTTLNVPTGITAFGEGLAIADAWNHRVLIWRRMPVSDAQPADLVLGQAHGTRNLANRGDSVPGADTLNWPYGVAEIDGCLVVCDTGNRRVLIWTNPRRNGQAADRVLGQESFDCRDENAGGAISASSMRWPHCAAKFNGKFAVADAGNNRVMVWSNGLPATNIPCDQVPGQLNSGDCDHNQGAYWPHSGSLNMPYGLASCSDKLLVIADTANSRLTGWNATETGGRALHLAGQVDFRSKGDNRWSLPTRDSMCWPYGLAVRGDDLAIADSGNNRVLIWKLANER